MSMKINNFKENLPFVEKKDFSNYQILYDGKTIISGITTNKKNKECGKDILWLSGDLPELEFDWDSLEKMKITTIFNFSYWPLKRMFGFEIINFAPNIISLCMPMTDQENDLSEAFIRVVGQTQRAQRLYICGLPRHRAVLSLLLAAKRNLNIHIEFDIPYEDTFLLKKYI